MASSVICCPDGPSAPLNMPGNTSVVDLVGEIAAARAHHGSSPRFASSGMISGVRISPKKHGLLIHGAETIGGHKSRFGHATKIIRAL